MCLTIRGKKLNLEGTNCADEVKKLWEIKGIKNNIDVLLLFLWVLNKELCMATMHPECLFVDLTHGANSQNKQLNMVAFKDGDNNVFPGAHAFQPNARQVMFPLFFREGLAALWPKAVIERNRFFVTDGDIHMCTPLTKAKDNKIWPNTTVGRCTFHLPLVGWKKHVDRRSIENLKPTLRKTHRWIESWMIPGLSECFQHCL